ncbi:MAG: class I SAM-dependent methyltransferase [Gordonia sp. (in: high G+C Gram-positive bacteria)]|uniref:class I SAM-dependent methyltransferase n=1 Tax=Gordonia sp. (in: high G+C Gram-positive bacteria) TaxID=84139 RepID=UPI0039E512A3
MNWFSAGGDVYARHRPSYPTKLARQLADAAPGRACAVDVGCGTGFLTALLAEYFDEVYGLDPSADQLANASPRPAIEYRVAAAEATGLPDGSVDLITAAQAAHWFDLPAFYDEARRIAVDGALLALVTYGVARLEPDLQARFDRFYTDEVGPYWEPERRHVDNRYADLEFPFERVDITVADIERDWTLEEFAGYLHSWSAVRKAEKQGVGDLVTGLIDDLYPVWGGEYRHIRWPVTVLAGRIDEDT